MSNPVSYQSHGAVAVLQIDNPPVNALSRAVRQGLADWMDRAEADQAVRAVLITGDGRAFIAGADITEFGKPPQEPNLPDLCTRIEGSPLLVVASIHGVALGGGLEVALGAHYRIARPQARVGLPEVNLGLLPGAGGTQRLPRLTGAAAAIEAMTTGRQIQAEEALALGIIDRIAEGDPLEVGLAYAQELLDRGRAAPGGFGPARAGACRLGRRLCGGAVPRTRPDRADSHPARGAGRLRDALRGGDEDRTRPVHGAVAERPEQGDDPRFLQRAQREQPAGAEGGDAARAADHRRDRRRHHGCGHRHRGPAGADAGRAGRDGRDAGRSGARPNRRQPVRRAQARQDHPRTVRRAHHAGADRGHGLRQPARCRIS